MSLKQRIKSYLENRPESKDSDNELCKLIWTEDLLNMGLFDFTYFGLFYGEGKLSSGYNIVRTRQQLQQADQSLRGNLYKKRKKLGEKRKEAIRAEKAEKESPGYPRLTNRGIAV